MLYTCRSQAALRVAGLSLLVFCLAAAACRSEALQKNRIPGGPSAAAATSTIGGKTNMQALEIAITPKHSEVLIGESLMVDVTLQNAGQTAVEVPSPDFESEFEFLLRPTEEGREPYVLSALDARYERLGEHLPEEEIPKVPLKPGDSLSYTEDISKYATGPFLPGRYILSVVSHTDDGRVESPEEPVTIVVPRVLHMAVAPGPSEGRLGLVLAHVAAGGGTTVFQRVSRPKVPTDGVWFRRVDVAAPASVGGVASAVEFDRKDLGVRWFAWLQDDALGAVVAEEHTVLVLIDPVPLHLGSATIQSVGWQPSVQSAAFAVLGKDGQGSLIFAAATFLATGSASVNTVSLTNSKMPLHWAARYRMRNGAVNFDVVTVEDAADKVRVQRQSVVPDKGTAEPPIVLTERPEPLVALALYPVAGAEPGVVDALLGPVGEKAQMTFLRLPLDGGPPIAEWSFAVPYDPDNKPPSAWAIASQPLSDPVVLAKVSDRLMVRRAAGSSEWSTLAINALEVKHFRLEVIGDGAVWAIWADPAAGIQYGLVP